MTERTPAGQGKTWRWLALACLVALVWSGPASAETSGSLAIKEVRIGFPAEGGRRLRPGAWAPVQVDLQAGSEGVAAEAFALVVQTADSDDVQARYRAPVPALGKDERRTVLTYYRPGTRTARLTVLVQRADGRTVTSLEQAPAFGDLLHPETVLYLSLGPPLPGLSRALTPSAEKEQTAGKTIPRPGFASITSVMQMPDRWYGYGAASVLVLNSSSESFVHELLGDASASRLEALRGWIQRGGRLVVSLGKNAREAINLLERLGIRAFALERVEKRTGRIEDMRGWVLGVKEPFPGERGLEMARLRADNRAVVLVSDHQGKTDWPVVAVTPCSLGCVLVVSFDLDAPAFTAWPGQSTFFEEIQDAIAPRLETRTATQSIGPDELGSPLQRGLESFDGVAVVSFGWVAFFILLYILLIAPLDYLFLKKVVKRLELTWVTLPVVVLVVSIGAWSTASSLKGNAQRVNKIDVIDIDLHNGAVQGTTWFALFSPKVKGYTLGVTPAEGWTPGAERVSTVVTTLSPPDSSAGGVDRPASQPLFRRPYVYAPDASGLKEVPVPAWASRSFNAIWRTRPKQMPIEVQDFGLSRDGERLIGRIHNRLPVELNDVTLFYNGNGYELDDIPAGGYYRIDGRDVRRSGGGSVLPWMSEPFGRSDEGRGRTTDLPAPEALMKTILFHGVEGGPYSSLNNSNLRLLDQGWRLRGLRSAREVIGKQFPDEAIVVGRAKLPTGPADAVSGEGVSATRLWIGRLPGEGDPPPLDGYLSQETYIRIYIPIKSEW
jgi:hypothetical protein